MTYENIVIPIEDCRSEGDLDCFLAAFEGPALPKRLWTHGAHVAVAAIYLWGRDPQTVLPKMRHSIRTHNESVGTANTDSSGYHETLTVFWLRTVDAFLREGRFESRVKAVRAAIEEFAPRRDLFVPYYSFDVVRSKEARAVWLEPDVKL